MHRHAIRAFLIGCGWLIGLVAIVAVMRFVDAWAVAALFLIVVAAVPVAAYRWCGVRTRHRIFSLSFTVFFLSIAVFVLIGIAGERLEALLR